MVRKKHYSHRLPSGVSACGSAEVSSHPFYLIKMTAQGREVTQWTNRSQHEFKDLCTAVWNLSQDSVACSVTVGRGKRQKDQQEVLG